MKTSSQATLRPLALLALLLAGCAGTGMRTPPPAAAPPPVLRPSEAGKASFFFPVEVPLAEVRRIVEESLPPKIGDERRQEISGALRDGYYRYDLERGPVEVGFTDGRLTFAFPVHGSLTVGGTVAGLPVHQAIDVAGRVRGTAAPEIGPDWQPDPRPEARIELDRADLQVLGLFPLSVRGLLEERLNPLLDRELKRAAARLMAGLSLRRRAEEAWRSLHLARRAVAGEDLWVRFQPLEVSLARLTLRDGVLHGGLGISGQLALALAPSMEPPAVTLLPPLRVGEEQGGGFELEAPVAASPEELTRWVDRVLRGERFRLGRDREMEITGAGLGTDSDRLVLALDFRTGGRAGRLVLRGRPALVPGTPVLRLDDLQYDLAAGGPALRLADRLHRGEILERLRKAARLDLTPLLAQAQNGARQAVQELLPAGLQGEVRIAPVQILGVGVEGGAVWARCRLAGTIPPLAR